MADIQWLDDEQGNPISTVASPSVQWLDDERGNPIEASFLGNIAKAGVRNVAGLAAALDYLPLSPNAAGNYTGLGRKILDWWSGEDSAPTFMELQSQEPIRRMEAARQSYIGDPNYTGKSAVERYVTEGLAAAPLAFSLNPMAVASAATSGVGAEVAKDLNINPLVGALVGSVVPGAVAKGASYISRPFTNSGQRILAGQELLDAAGPEGRQNLLNALTGSGDDLTGKTFAELADSPSAAAYQTSKRLTPGEGTNTFENALARRAADRAKELQGVTPSTMSDISLAERGGIVQSEAAKIAEGAWAQAGKAYEDIADFGAIPVQQAQKDISSLVDKVFGKSKIKIDSQADDVIKGFLNDEPKQLSDLKALQSDAGVIIGRIARSNPKAKELPILSTLRQKIDKALTEASKGDAFPAQQVKNLQEARAGYAETGRTYGSRLVKDITRKGEYGEGFRLAPEDAIKRVISKRDNAAKFMRAYGDQPKLVTQARAALVDQMVAKEATDAGVRLKTSLNYFDKNKDIFESIFQKDLPKVERVLEDLRSELRVGELASRASGSRSFTTQGVTVAKKLATDGPRMMLRLLGVKGAPVGAGGVGYAVGNIPGAILGYSAAKVAQWAEGNIQRIIMEGMSDSQILKQLVMPASKKSTESVLRSLIPVLATGQDKDKKEFINRIQTEQENAPEVKKRAEIDAAYAQRDAVASRIPSLNKRVSMEDVDLNKLTDAVIKQESGGKVNAISNVGAQGLMQLMPDTGKELFRKYRTALKDAGVESNVYAPFNAEQNKFLGTMYLRELLKQFNNDPKLALTAYHSGPGRVSKLLKKHGATTFEEIQPHLGPIGQKYAMQVIDKMNKQKAVMV